MKRVGNIYDKISSMEAVQVAEKTARKGKKKSYGVALHDKNREENLLNIFKDLNDETFVPSPCETFTIYEPKKRVIFKVPFDPDRIVHHAYMNASRPVWDAVFTTDTYGSIKGRGIMGCAVKLKKALQKEKYFWNGEKWQHIGTTEIKPKRVGKINLALKYEDLPKEGNRIGQQYVLIEKTRYCLKLDVNKFYPSVNHEIMKSIVRRKIKDKKHLNLNDLIIDSAGPGLPIGYWPSQYLANLYLAYFDHWLKEVKGVEHYYRYVDDMVILSDSKEFLHGILIDIKEYLWENLRLTVKPNHQVFPIDPLDPDKPSRGIDFLGYVFRHTHTDLRKGIKRNFWNAVKKKKDRKHIASFYGWAVHADARHLMKLMQITDTNGKIKQNARKAA